MAIAQRGKFPLHLEKGKSFALLEAGAFSTINSTSSADIFGSSFGDENTIRCHYMYHIKPSPS